MPVERRMFDAVLEVDEATPMALAIWYGLVVAGLVDLWVLLFAPRRYRGSRLASRLRS